MSPRVRRPYIDRTLYKFGFRTEVEELRLGNDKLQVLKTLEPCRQLLVPEEAVLTLKFGIARDQAKCRGPQKCAGIFRATLQTDRARHLELIDTKFSFSQPELSMTRTVDLSEYAYERVQLCLRAFASSNLQTLGKRSPLFWHNPKVRAKGDPIEDPGQTGALTREEEKTLAKQLEALGYIN